MKKTLLALSIVLNLLLTLCIFAIYRVSREETIYASGYSDNSFYSISCGMRKEDVKKILGDPLKSYVKSATGQVVKRCENLPCDVPPEMANKSNEIVWQYTRETNATNYQIRSVIFSEDGNVKKTYSMPYTD